MRLLLALGLAALSSSQAAADVKITWELEEYDAGPALDSSVPRADLVLPIPCGGAMALMRIDTEARADNPLDDQRFRMGAPDIARAPYQYTRNAYIRGAFPDKDANTTHYFLGRYEVTVSQYEAVTAWAQGKDCPTRDQDTGDYPATNISWFDTQNFMASLSEWSRENLPDLMPKTEGKMGFYRLPSEAEWEFAARGGRAAGDTAAFNARRFPMDGKLKDYTWHDGHTSSGGKLQYFGGLKPNPLGLYDIYGNAEEIVFELFTLNNGGRRHGQFGGFVARGGSFKSKPSEIGSATRSEYPFYQIGLAAPVRFDKIGMRVALANFVLSSDRVIVAVEDAWEQELDPADKDDPRALISRMVEEEVELSKRSELESVQSALVNALREGEEATALAMQRAVFGGATILRAMENLRARAKSAQQRVTWAENEGLQLQKDLDEARKASSSEAVLQTYKDIIEDTSNTLIAAQRRLSDINRDLEIDGTNYVATLEAVYVSSTQETLRREADLLLAEMDRTDQLAMVKPIDGFVALVEAYRENPSMTRAEILAFGVE